MFITKFSILIWLVIELLSIGIAAIFALADASETNWIGIGTALGLIIVAVGTAYNGIITNRAKIASELAAAEIQRKLDEEKRKREEESRKREQDRQVAKKTQTKLDDLAKVTTATYHLNNGAMTTQLKKLAELTRFRADHKKSDPVFEKEAADAEEALADHVKKQKLVDATVNEVIGQELKEEVHKQIDETSKTKGPSPVVDEKLQPSKHSNPEE